VEGGEPFVVANGAEGEPGSIKDRHLLRTRAADVLSGLALAARGVGAREAVVFLKRSFAREGQAVGAALAAGAARGLAVRVAHGDDSYIVGEETALLESLEGRRPWPRPKPPLPAAVGYEGRPTLVHNVETLMRLPGALADPDAFRAGEPTYVSLWGDVQRPGLYEVRLGTPLRALIDDHGGGAPDGIAFVFPGGPSSPPLGEGELDTALQPDALRARGSSLGTASLLVVGRSRDPFDLAVSLAAFFERESCGQCPPCVRGTESLHRIARALRAGQARSQDVGDVGEVAGFMEMHGYCAHCRAAAGSMVRLVSLNQALVQAVVAGARARAAQGVPFDPFSPGSPQRAAIEAMLA
jgi:NADH-quinone oxidoreductase subunit F